MNLAAWGQQEKNAFDLGMPIEFILQASATLQAGDTVEVKFFNAEGELSKETGVVSHSEPGLIQIRKRA